MEAREERGLAIAESAKIHRKGNDVWAVPSQSGTARYWVKLNGEVPLCTCPDYELRAQRCKHIYAVEYTLEREAREKEVLVAPERCWATYNTAKTSEKAKFVGLLSDLCRGIPEPMRGKGRPRLSLSDMAFSCAYKVYSGFSARRFTTDLKEAQMRGLIEGIPHFNSVNRYLSDPELTEVLKGLITLSSLPLKGIETSFAVDSSGFSTCRFVRWFNKKYGRVRLVRLGGHLKAVG